VPVFFGRIGKTQFAALDSNGIEIRVSYDLGAEIIPVPASARTVEEALDYVCHFRLGSVNAEHALFVFALR
jgi:hypothetical protein